MSKRCARSDPRKISCDYESRSKRADWSPLPARNTGAARGFSPRNMRLGAGVGGALPLDPRLPLPWARQKFYAKDSAENA